MHRYGLSPDGETITLRLFNGDLPLQPQASSKGTLLATFLDLETTGLDVDKSKIIEVGILQFRFQPQEGVITEITKEYTSFQDPGYPIPPVITELTGIDDTMVVGQAMDRDEVESIIRESDLLISHNASFDRAFIDREFPISESKVWACSMTQVNWKALGFPCRALSHLAMEHGFFYEPHRAMTDVKAAVYLLSFRDLKEDVPYLKHMYEKSCESSFLVSAVGAPFDKKDLLKERKFRWNAPKKVWQKKVSEEESEELKSWLSEAVYEGKCRANFQAIQPCDSFKNR